MTDEFVSEWARGRLATYDGATIGVLVVDGDGADAAVDTMAFVSEVTISELARGTTLATVDQVGSVGVLNVETVLLDTSSGSAGGVWYFDNSTGSDSTRRLLAFLPTVTAPGFVDWPASAPDGIGTWRRGAASTTTAAAAAVSVDATGFAGNLSGTDTDVQTALGTLDAMATGGGTGIGPVFVYNSSGSTTANRYTSWSTLMADVATIDGPKIIQFEQNETITASGMPGGGWDLNGATLMGVNALAWPAVFITFSEGVKLVGWGSVAVSTGCILYSKSSTPVWEISDHASHEFRDSGVVMAETCEFIRCTEGVGDVVEFRFFNGSGFVRPDTWGPLFAGDGSYEALAANGSGDVALKDTAGSSALQDDTIRGAGTVYRLAYNGCKHASYPAATGDTQTNASDYHIDLLSVADRHAYDHSTSGLAATNVQDAIDEIVASGGGTGDVVGPASSVDGRVVLFDGTTGKLLKDGGALPTQYTDEMARDAIGTALTGGTGITVTPNDGADTITVAVAAGSITTTQIADGTITRTDADPGSFSTPRMLVPTGSWSSGTNLGTPLCPAATASTLAVALGDAVGFRTDLYAPTITTLVVKTTATSLTAGQAVTICVYDISASTGLPTGTPLSTTTVTLGTTVGEVEAGSLSLTTVRPGRFVVLHNPSTNAGSVTLTCVQPTTGFFGSGFATLTRPALTASSQGAAMGDVSAYTIGNLPAATRWAYASYCPAILAR